MAKAIPISTPEVQVEKGTIWLLKIVFLDKCKFTLRGSKVHLGFSYAFLDEK